MFSILLNIFWASMILINENGIFQKKNAMFNFVNYTFWVIIVVDDKLYIVHIQWQSRFCFFPEDKKIDRKLVWEMLPILFIDIHGNVWWQAQCMWSVILKRPFCNHVRLHWFLEVRNCINFKTCRAEVVIDWCYKQCLVLLQGERRCHLEKQICSDNFDFIFDVNAFELKYRESL